MKKNFPKLSEIKIEVKISIDGVDIPIPQLIGKSKTCVYMITNKVNGKKYIGQTTNIFNRMNRHKNDLIGNKHIVTELQSDFNSQLPYWTFRTNENAFSNNFEFSILVYCYASELEFWEKLLISVLKPEYNQHKQKAYKHLDSEK